MSVQSMEIFGGFTINPFGTLVSIAAITAYLLACRRGRETGLDEQILIEGAIWCIAASIVGSHWVSEIFYYPKHVLNNPLTLLMVWGSMSSYGGFFGGLLGAFIYFKIKKALVMPYMDALLFGFVPAWIIGRLGCTITFDHPGRATDFFMGMVDRYGVVRHNLGFYEMLWTIILTLLLYRLKNVRYFEGFHYALFIFLYAPMRIFLDTFRVGEITYWGLIPSHYFSVILLGLGLFLILRGLKLNAGGLSKPGEKE
jgi:phosphatidylglycerol:prolipoprotein diacylglycerol transferase